MTNAHRSKPKPASAPPPGAAGATLTYRNGEDVRELKAEGDPFEVCNAVRDLLFPGIQLPTRDEKFDAIMAKR